VGSIGVPPVYLPCWTENPFSVSTGWESFPMLRSGADRYRVPQEGIPVGEGNEKGFSFQRERLYRGVVGG